MSDDETKAAIDAMIYGTGILRDGKHVSVDDFYPEPPEERPNATDYRNKGERDAAYWREIADKLAKTLMDAADILEDECFRFSARECRVVLAEYEAARINAEALR